MKRKCETEQEKLNRLQKARDKHQATKDIINNQLQINIPTQLNITSSDICNTKIDLIKNVNNARVKRRL